MPATVGTIEAIIRARLDGLRADRRAVRSEMNGLVGDMRNASNTISKIFKLTIGAIVVRKIFDLAEAVVQVSSNIEESRNVIDVAFKSMGDSAVAWADTTGNVMSSLQDR